MITWLLKQCPLLSSHNPSAASSVTGTFSVSLSNAATDRFYVASYTINAANTWERKSISMSGDTAGSWLTNNGAGIIVSWSLGAGPNMTTAAPGGWTGSLAFAVTGQVDLMANVMATFQISGVQLEHGTTPTRFEARPYDHELRRCQRYYQVTDYFQGTGTSATTMVVVAPALIPMRGTIAPSIAGTTWAASDNYAADANASSPTMPNIYDCSARGARVALGGFTGLTVGRYYNSRPSTTSLIGLSAEL